MIKILNILALLFFIVSCGTTHSSILLYVQGGCLKQRLCILDWIVNVILSMEVARRSIRSFYGCTCEDKSKEDKRSHKYPSFIQV